MSPMVVSRSTYVSFLHMAASSATVTSMPLLLLVVSDVCRLLDRSSFGVSARLPSAQMSPRVLQTSQGKLRGILITRSSPGHQQQQQQLPPVEAYLGLQYASTLGSNLRFMPPTSSMEKWEGIRVALKFRPVCPQPLPDIDHLSRKLPRGRVDHFRRLMPFLERQNEDCLYLNIYTPFRGQ
jgi:neuroligin